MSVTLTLNKTALMVIVLDDDEKCNPLPILLKQVSSRIKMAIAGKTMARTAKLETRVYTINAAVAIMAVL
jgi:hypothetical protein